MRVGVYGRPEFKMMNALAIGLEKQGHQVVWQRDSVFTPAQVDKSFDIIAVPGLRSHCKMIKETYENIGIDTIVVDIGHLRRDLGYHQIGLNKLGWTPDYECDDFRLKKLGIKYEQQDQGTKILIAAQVLDDASHGLGEDGYSNWVKNAVKTLQSVSKKKIVLRPHPTMYGSAVRKGLGNLVDEISPEYKSLENDLKDAFCVVTHCSTTGLDAALKGVPVFCDKSSAYAKFVETNLKHVNSAKPMEKADAEKMFKSFTYGQWTLEEIASGEAVDFLFDVRDGHEPHKMKDKPNGSSGRRRNRTK